MKQYLVIHQTLVIAFIVIGAIALSAIASNYAGSIQFRLGPDGIQLQMDGVDSSSIHECLNARVLECRKPKPGLGAREATFT